ncbi:hypothetical protein [Bosea massiliensis]|uniref:Uncharacterized protein n=1 Tax=Bosea massiliensis TaxID=151419 RepID=A0ABW0P7U0_9HYPH
MTKADGNFERRWTGRKIARIAFMRAKGWSYRQIAAELGDGTRFETIGAVCRRWKLPVTRRGQRMLLCTMTHREAGQVAKEARKRKMDTSEWIGKVAGAAARGKLYDAILDEG